MVKNKKSGKKLFGFESNVISKADCAAYYLLALSTMVAYEATPKKYKLTVGSVSQYDINAPRDIENTLKTRENAELKAAELEPVIVPIEGANDSITSGAYAYFDGLSNLLNQVRSSGQKEDLATLIQEYDRGNYYSVLIQIPEDKLLTLLTDESEILRLKTVVINSVLPGIKRKQLMEENLGSEKEDALAQVRTVFDDESIQFIAEDLLDRIIVPNSRIDEKATEEERNALIETAVKENPVIIYKDERIISKDEIVTEDKFQVLKELNYIDSEGKPDYLLYIAVFMLIFAMYFLTMLYLRNFHKKLYYDKNAVMLVGVSIIIACLFALLFREFIPDYAPLIIPTLIAPVICHLPRYTAGHCSQYVVDLQLCSYAGGDTSSYSCR